MIKNVTREEKCFGKIKKSAVTDTPVNVKHICEERMTMKIEENEWEQIVTIPYNIIMKKKDKFTISFTNFSAKTVDFLYSKY